MNSLIFTNNEKNYLVEFQSINGYESFIKKKNQISNVNNLKRLNNGCKKYERFLK